MANPRNFDQKWEPAERAGNDDRAESDNAGRLLLAEASGLRRQDSEEKRETKSVCAAALRELRSPSSEIFEVKSGRWKGTDVPVAVRCAIFQSNLAVEAGIIGKNDVTIRALDLEKTLKSKGFRAEKFEPGRNYPDGTYIVGEGARDGTNSRHIAMVCGNQLIHTKEGVIVREPISAKYFAGAYDRMTVLRRK